MPVTWWDCWSFLSSSWYVPNSWPNNIHVFNWGILLMEWDMRPFAIFRSVNDIVILQPSCHSPPPPTITHVISARANGFPNLIPLLLLLHPRHNLIRKKRRVTQTTRYFIPWLEYKIIRWIVFSHSRTLFLCLSVSALSRKSDYIHPTRLIVHESRVLGWRVLIRRLPQFNTIPHSHAPKRHRVIKWAFVLFSGQQRRCCQGFHPTV